MFIAFDAVILIFNLLFNMHNFDSWNHDILILGNVFHFISFSKVSHFTGLPAELHITFTLSTNFPVFATFQHISFLIIV